MSSDHLDLKLFSPGPNQSGVALEATSDGDDVGRLVVEELLGELSALDGSNARDNTVGSLKGGLDGLGERSLVSRSSDDLLGGVESSGRNVDEVDTASGKEGSELDGLLNSPGRLVLNPVKGGDTEEEGHVFGDGSTDGLNNLEGEAGAVLERSSVLVGTLVGEGREERVEEVSVSVVDLDDVVSGVNSALGGGSEGINGGLDLLLGHGLRNGELLVVGDVRGSVDLLGPSTLLLSGDHSTVDPGGEGRGLASSVGNLDTDLLAL